MTLTVTGTPGATTVSVTGELDLTVAEQLRQRLAGEIASASRALVIDLTGVSFCSAAILRVLIQTTAAADAAAVAWAVVSDQRAVRRPISLIGLDPVLRPDSSLAAAYDRLSVRDRPSAPDAVRG